MLKFSTHNSKINLLAGYLGFSRKQVICFDLPAGYTCPMADKCKSYSDKESGKIRDGKGIEWRCYAASSESAFTCTRKMRWHNFDLLRGKSVKQMCALIEQSLPENVKVVRIHSSGDFFSRSYFEAWLNVAKNHPEIIFFGYTKILEYARICRITEIKNMKLNYSFGGKQDSLLEREDIVTYVVKSMDEARERGIPVACVDNPADDFEYIMQNLSFGILLHGTQPAKKRR